MYCVDRRSRITANSRSLATSRRLIVNLRPHRRVFALGLLALSCSQRAW